jgi:hypothetical protein
MLPNRKCLWQEILSHGVIGCAVVESGAVGIANNNPPD